MLYLLPAAFVLIAIAAVNSVGRTLSALVATGVSEDVFWLLSPGEGRDVPPVGD